MQHHSRDIRIFSQRGVAHHVHVGEPGDPQRIAKAIATRAFKVGEDFETLRDLKACVQRLNARRGMTFLRLETVITGILRVERRVLLPDEVSLERDPEAILKAFLGESRRKG